MSYPAALKQFKDLSSQRPDVVQSIEDAIDKHVERLSAFRSDQAGSKILPNFPELSDCCGAMAAQVFGIIVREHLQDDWVKTSVIEKGKRVTYYNRRDD